MSHHSGRNPRQRADLSYFDASCCSAGSGALLLVNISEDGAIVVQKQRVSAGAEEKGGCFLLQLDTVDFSAGDLISVIRALKGSGISSQLEDQIGHI